MRHDGLAEVAIGHAHVHCLADGEVIGARVHQVRHPQQDFGPLLMMHAAPGAVLEGLRRGLDRGIGVDGGGLGDAGDRRLGCRVGRGHRRAIGGVAPRSADQQLAGGNGLPRGRRILCHGLS